MEELIRAVFSAPIANLLIIAGLVFLGIAIVGKVSGRIEPDRTGRVVSGVVGVVLVLVGLALPFWPPNGGKPTSTPTDFVATGPAPPTHTPVPPSPASIRPSETATPTFTATPTLCSTTPGPTFRSVWSSYLRDVLGCPVTIEQSLNSAFQAFERGYMMWLDDGSDLHYVLSGDDILQALSSEWDRLTEYSCAEGEAPTAMYTPRRGNGWVWCNRPGVRQALGWALLDEIGYLRPVQFFQRGLMIGVRDSVVPQQYRGLYLLQRSSGNWLFFSE